MTTEKPFTPGPWSVESPFGNDDLAIVADADREVYDWNILASCFSSDGDGEPAIPVAEMQANARLIAASPDLYEALDLLLKTIDPGQWPSDEMVSALHAGTVALAKARGETP